MKQFIFLSLMTLLGAIGALQSPFWAVLLYYGLAVLKPQALWSWALTGDMRWSLVAALLVLGSIALNFSNVFKRIRMNAVLGMILAFSVLLLCSALTAFNPATAQSWGVDYAKVLLMAILASLLIEHLWQVRALGLIVLLALGYIAWEVNVAYLWHGQRLDFFTRGFSGLDNNGVALMLAMGMPFAYAFIVCNTQRWRWWLAGLSLLAGGCLLHAVLLSYSRGAMVAGAIGMAWLLWCHRPRWQAAGMALAGIVVIALLAGPQVRDRFKSTADYQQDHSAQLRFESWDAAWDMAWTNPLLGKGIRNSEHFTHNFGADMQGRVVHNLYLELAADSGIPAALLYIALLGTCLWRLGATRRMCMGYEPTPEEDDETASHTLHATAAICLAIQSSLMIFAVDAMFLSVGTFELPWMLIVLAGVAPPLVERWIAEQPNVESPQPNMQHRLAARRPRSGALAMPLSTHRLTLHGDSS